MRTREFKEWLYEPSFEESVCANPFHDIAKKVFDGYSSMNRSSRIPMM